MARQPRRDQPFVRENVKFLDERDVQFVVTVTRASLHWISDFSKEEITAMIEEDNGAEVVCQFVINAINSQLKI